MQERTIDLGELFKFSFFTYKNYFSFIAGIMVTYLILGIVPQVYFALGAPETPTVRSQLFSLFLTLLQLYLALGFTKVMLLLIDGHHTKVTDLFNNARLFLSYFVASFLYGLGVLAGLFFLVVPGIFIAIRFQFYPYFILEHEDSAFISLRKSYKMTHHLTLDLFLFGITVLVLNLLGVLFMGLGIILTYPFTVIATAVIYKGLDKEAELIPTEPYREAGTIT